MFRALAALLTCSWLIGCATDSNAERLDEQPALDPREVAAMLKLDCSQRREEVQTARDEQASDFDRVASYKLALKAYTGASERIEAAFTKEPDLLYAAEGDALRLRLQRCQAQAKTFTDELRRFEQSLQFKPKEEVAEAPKAAPAPAPAAAVPTKVSAADDAFDAPVAKSPKLTKKQLKKKAMLAKLAKKKKKLGRGGTVLASATH